LFYKFYRFWYYFCIHEHSRAITQFCTVGCSSNGRCSRNRLFSTYSYPFIWSVHSGSWPTNVCQL